MVDGAMWLCHYHIHTTMETLIIWIYIHIYIHTSGWWFQPTPLKNDGVKVSWDDDIPIIWKVIKHVPNHQPGYKELDDN